MSAVLKLSTIVIPLIVSPELARRNHLICIVSNNDIETQNNSVIKIFIQKILLLFMGVTSY